ncbi:fumarylacetoacetase [Leptodontidium sp. MPI-SDFR-AT-0119]|nr:fumarylacetoacetase [Leptodontidium sp. MPI-SDFR-AT-0119]
MGLPPNISTLPIGYHGRKSSIVVSGTAIWLPRAQIIFNGTPAERLSQELDFEVEFAAFIGRGNEMGSPIDVNKSTSQGPFNGKNFCTTISPWIVTLEALEPFRTTPLQFGPRLPYLNQDERESVYDIPVRVSLESGSGIYSVTECNTKHVVFSFAQMLAHHTVGGCPMRPGDLIATGTLSGPNRRELGCLLEATQNGVDPYEMEAQSPGKQNISRTFLEDGDIIKFRAQAQGKNGLKRVGFGACRGN